MPTGCYTLTPKRNSTVGHRKKANVLPLHFRQFKPYVSLPLPAKASQTKGMYLLDTGLSDALWLFSMKLKLMFLTTGIRFRLNQVKASGIMLLRI